MPNGWYPVPGLDVVLINRTEQRYPRLDWDQSWEEFWAVEFIGPGGFTPRGELRSPVSKELPPFERLVEQTRALIAKDRELPASGSVVFINFKRKEGWAAGSFCVYGFKAGSVSVIHDLTVGATILRGGLPEGFDMAEHAHVLGCRATMIDANGLTAPPSGPESGWRFEFAEMDSLVVSSTALHYDAHWPPKTSLDGVAMALAQKDRHDTLVALWKAEDASGVG